MKIALLGAESTGKSDLGKQLERHFVTQGKIVQHIPEYLRSWCDERQRTPRMDEQLSIANEQIRQINAASADSYTSCDFLIADTTPLLTAVYSDLIFNDNSLYDLALLFQRSFDITLLMGLDMPWVADGIQRDGPHMREPVDAKIRAALAQSNINYQVIYGSGEDRLQLALQCLNLGSDDASNQVECLEKSEMKPQKRRNWVCERCSDPVCEHRLFRDLLNNP